MNDASHSLDSNSDIAKIQPDGQHPFLSSTDSESKSSQDRLESKPAAVIKDEYFYVDTVTFKAGNTLFKVPKAGLLVPGTAFEAMLSPKVGGDSVQNKCPEKPIEDGVVDISVDEESFRTFLSFLYTPAKVIVTPPEDVLRNLLGALDLAILWGHTLVKQQVIEKFSARVKDLGDVEVIYLSRKYRMAEWLHSRYKALVLNPRLSVAEHLRTTENPLDWETIAGIYTVRDTMLRSDAAYCHTCMGTVTPAEHECLAVKLINQHFRNEFESLMNCTLPDQDWNPEPSQVSPISVNGGFKKKKKKKATVTVEA